MQLSVGKSSSPEAFMSGTVLIKEDEVEGILSESNSKHAYEIKLKFEE